MRPKFSRAEFDYQPVDFKCISKIILSAIWYIKLKKIAKFFLRTPRTIDTIKIKEIILGKNTSLSKYQAKSKRDKLKLCIMAEIGEITIKKISKINTKNVVFSKTKLKK